jgi:heme/copper-type cytochrome/quinol oxidase subunit 4
MKFIKDFLNSKKAQLGWIEMKYWAVGFLIGIILTLVIVYLANAGILIPFKLGFLCPAK